MTARRSWKRTESRIASLVGGERVPITGRGRGDQPDIAHAWLSPEVKHRKELPAWLLGALAQAEAAAGSDQLPVAIVHGAGDRYRDALVVVRLASFVEWFGPAELMGDI